MYNVELDSYINKLACESIMFELYSSEFENTIASESTCISFDDDINDDANIPAFEAAKRSFIEVIKDGFAKVIGIFKRIGEIIGKAIASLFKKKKAADNTEYDVTDNGDSIEITAENKSDSKKHKYKLSKKEYTSVQDKTRKFDKWFSEYYKEAVVTFIKISNGEKALMQIYNEAMQLTIAGKSIKDAVASNTFDNSKNPKADMLFEKAKILCMSTSKCSETLSAKSFNVNEWAHKFKNDVPEITKAIASFNKAKGTDIDTMISRAKETQKNCETLIDEIQKLQIGTNHAFYSTEEYFKPNGDSNLNSCGKVFQCIAWNARYLSTCCYSFIHCMTTWTEILN